MTAKPHLLLIDSKKTSPQSFAPALVKRGYRVSRVHTVPAAVQLARTDHPIVVILDNTHRNTNAERMCRNLSHDLPQARLLLLLAADATPSPRCPADTILQKPFTVRKVINHVQQLLPATDGDWLSAGPIRLNLDHRRLIYGSVEETLTPKQARLLEVLIRHQGQVVTRKFLIKQVWHTDYVGDTRTLDVHISWLRNVLANGHTDRASLYRHIKTVRGQGYRLVV